MLLTVSVINGIQFNLLVSIASSCIYFINYLKLSI